MKLLPITLFALTLIVSCARAPKAEKIAIIPQPVELIIDKQGEFKLSNKTKITYPNGDSEMEKAARTIAELLGAKLGVTLKVIPNDESDNSIELKKWHNAPKAEAYKLDVSDDGIEIEAADYQGALYAMQTIMQLLPETAYGKAPAKAYRIPKLEITDYPRFAWRGMHLDCSRHFFTADEVRKYIDYLAMHKLNRFHWHLTDDQGWRMESKKYPLLTQKAAWRVDRSADDWDNRQPLDPAKGEKPTYGGFYTQQQIKELVEYAEKLGVVIVPEIEVPGHSSEIFAAYPELSCLGKEQFVTPGGYYPVDLATCYCAGNDQVFTFLEGIIDEVVELFPNAPYIHIGGDEVDKRFWKECPKCQARMKAEGFTNVDQLQSYFIKRVEKYINDKGKPIIGWDEIIEGGLAPNATVMSWRGIAGGIEAARQGHDVIMTPNSHLYFDYYQNNPQVEPKSIGGYITTKRVYGFEPIPEVLTAEQARHILGAQANLWVEFIQTFDRVEYMVLPRMSALSEVVWSPKESRNWDSFTERLVSQQKRYDAMGANYHKGADQIEFTTSYDSVNRTFAVALSTEFYGGEMYYTTDGAEPTMSSTKYTEPIKIDQTTTIRAIVGRDAKVISKISSERKIGMHKGVGKKIIYNHKPSGAYLGSGDVTLLDGLTGSTRQDDSYMQGFNSADFDVVIDLEKPTQFSSVSASFLQSAGAWIYLPREIVVSISDDNLKWSEVGRSTHSFDPSKTPTARHQFDIEGDNTARYVRIVGTNPKTIMGLPGGGTINWIFCDEIFIN